MIKSIITWQGIDKTGCRITNSYIGSYRKLLIYLKGQQITLVSKKIEYHLVSKHNNYFQQFIHDLADLLQTGLKLITAIELLQRKYCNPILKNNIHNTLKKLKSGATLAHALATHFNNNQPVDLELIAIAEQTHQLPQTLSQLASQFQIQQNIRKQLYKAMIYPSSVLFFTFFITLGLLVFAIPQFKSMYDNFNATLPLTTRIALSISDILVQHGLLISVFLITLIFLCWRLKPIKNLFFKKLRHMKVAYLWSSACANCIDSGLTVTRSIALANKTITDNMLQKSMRNAINQIKAGKTCGQALTHTRLLNHSQLYLIEVGESSATLNVMLKRIASQNVNQLQQRLENLSKWLEPVIMLFLALIVGGLIITMYLPIFNLGSLL